MAASASAVASMPPAPDMGIKRIRTVRLDGLVVLKIIKHCHDGLPTFVAGSLLGLDVEETLEVTNCFPIPSSTPDDDDDLSGEDYHIEMLKSLEDMNVENNQVGWYQSLYQGTVSTTDLVKTQFDFQENIGQNAVCIVYDPLTATQGSLPLRAFRLTEQFMAAYREKKFTLPESLEGAPIESSRIFEELPIVVHNPPLTRGLLFDMEQKGLTDATFDRLDLTSNPLLEKRMQNLIQQVDDFGSWHREAGYWERRLAQQKQQQEQWLAKRRAENAVRKENGQSQLPETDPKNPIFKPLDAKHVDRMDALLIAGRIGSYCEEINKFAGQTFSKLFLASQLRAGSNAGAAGAGAGAGVYA